MATDKTLEVTAEQHSEFRKHITKLNAESRDAGQIQLHRYCAKCRKVEFHLPYGAFDAYWDSETGQYRLYYAIGWEELTDPTVDPIKDANKILAEASEWADGTREHQLSEERIQIDALEQLQQESKDLAKRLRELIKTMGEGVASYERTTHKIEFPNDDPPDLPSRL